MSLFLFKTPKQESGKNGSSCLISLLPILSLLALAGCSTSALTTSPPSAAPPESSTTNISFDQPAKSKIDVLDKVSIDAAQAKEIGLEIGEVKHGFIIKTVEAPGSVGPDAELSRLVSTPSAGRATEVKARLGDAVKVGQVMAIIKSDPIGQVQSDLLQNTLQAKADIKQQEVQLKLSRVTYEREKTLYEEQVSAKADLQSAETQLEKDVANLSALKAKLDATIRVAQERLTLLGAPPDSARKVIAQGRIDPWVMIKAPASGLVIERNINPGELNDGTKPLFNISDLSEVWLFGGVFEKDIEDVKKGQDAVVTVDSLPTHKFPAKIIWVGDSINATTRTLPVRANVLNPGQLLKPGMFARMKIYVGRVPALLVPSSAIVQKGDRSLVFVEAGERHFEERVVQTGIDDQQNSEILSGLKPGERVVIRGGTALLGRTMQSSGG